MIEPFIRVPSKSMEMNEKVNLGFEKNMVDMMPRRGLGEVGRGMAGNLWMFSYCDTGRASSIKRPSRHIATQNSVSQRPEAATVVVGLSYKV